MRSIAALPRRPSPRLLISWRMYACALVLLAVCTVSARAQAPSERKCEICHGKRDFKVVLPDGTVRYLYVDPEVLDKSVHAEHRCESCHADVSEIPHPPGVKRVLCTRCHYKGNPVGAPQTALYKDYLESVHGRQVQAGNPKAPLCQDCHGSHDVLAPSDSLSHVNKRNVPEVCGRCHLEPYAQYRASVHGVALIEQGELDAPSCADCHGEHNILEHTDPRSTVFPTNVGKTCPRCHAAEGIMSKYGIKTEQVESYEESYHGVASKFGERTVANCASCHGVHDILPPDDPNSRVHIRNIPKTCGKCHPGANPNFARGKIHVRPESRESGAVYYVATAFKWLTVTVIFSLVVHIILDLNRKRRSRRRSH